MKNYRVRHGYAEVRLQLGGRHLYKYIGPDNADNRKLAAQWIAKKRYEFRADKLDLIIPATPIKMEQAAQVYFKLWFDAPEQNRSDVSKRKTAGHLKSSVEFFLGRDFHSITVEDGRKWRYELEKTIQPNTVNRRQRILSSMYERFNDWNQMGPSSPVGYQVRLPRPHHNPFKHVDQVSEKQFNRSVILGEQKLSRVLTWAWREDPPMYKKIFGAILSGLRKSDLEAVRGMGRVKVVEGKTGKLAELPLDFSGQDFILINERRRWDRLRLETDIEDFMWHGWRHQCASMLFLLGYPIEFIQKMLRHSSPDVTEGYIHGRGEMFAPALEQLEGKLIALTEKGQKLE